MALKIYAYSNHSEGANLLANALDVYLLKHDRSKYVPRRGDRIINWGASEVPIKYEFGIINNPKNVNYARNKLTTLKMLSLAGVTVPPFTTDPLEASLHKGKVVVRHTLYGQGGTGIEVVEGGSKPFPIAPLYTMYVKNKGEYRIHVAFGKVIDEQQKKRRNGAPKTDGIVRNLDNDWVFARHDINVPQVVRDQAVKAVEVLGLDFGGVDVLYNQHYDKAYVLEVNTAPGIEGTTVQKYKEAFEQFK